MLIFIGILSIIHQYGKKWNIRHLHKNQYTVVFTSATIYFIERIHPHHIQFFPNTPIKYLDPIVGSLLVINLIFYIKEQFPSYKDSHKLDNKQVIELNTFAPNKTMEQSPQKDQVFGETSSIAEFNSLSQERKNLIISVSNAIHQHNESFEFSIAITGKWGSGKSTVLNHIENGLHHINKHKPPKETTNVTVHFNPWAVDKKEGYQKALIDAFIKALAKYDESFKEKFQSYLKAILTDYNTKISNYFHLLQSRDPKSKFEQINQALIKNNLRLIVFIDDTDRLHQDEIFSLFQLIRAIGKFKNTFYVTAIDKDYITQSLEGKIERPESYQDKIFDLSIAIDDNTNFNQLDGILNDNDFKEFKNAIKEDLKDIEQPKIMYLANETAPPPPLDEILSSLFKSYRDVKRFHNTFSFYKYYTKPYFKPLDLFLFSIFQHFLFDDYLMIKRDHLELNKSILFEVVANENDHMSPRIVKLKDIPTSLFKHETTSKILKLLLCRKEYNISTLLSTQDSYCFKEYFKPLIEFSNDKQKLLSLFKTEPIFLPQDKKFTEEYTTLSKSLFDNYNVSFFSIDLKEELLSRDHTAKYLLQNCLYFFLYN
ncbi:KAP family NTPase [Halosquirtibacter xylanolyticus]|uniref:KAP family P-loop NTPase fold protein n=1 Tax=Halosquirtibacter xylanolyticus TaxID=3374599 RepID=UPI0037499122|nr:KAP family NTPase [Prolixibacteraceae bacterium]